MSTSNALQDLREAAEKMGLPEREIAHILRIAEANQAINERRAEQLEPVAPASSPILTFVKPARADLPPPQILWCEQCDQRVHRARAAGCASVWCKAKGKL